LLEIRMPGQFRRLPNEAPRFLVALIAIMVRVKD
jgi:hypothetical protein